MQVSPESEFATDGNVPLRLGIIGCSIARPRYGAAFALLPGVSVVAMADPDPRLMRAWGRLLGGEIALFADAQSLLSSEAPPDALVIDVPLLERAETIIAAIPTCRAI